MARFHVTHRIGLPLCFLGSLIQSRYLVMCGLILLRLAAYGPIPLAYCQTLFSWKYNINHLSDYTSVYSTYRTFPAYYLFIIFVPILWLIVFTNNYYAINPSSLNIFGRLINFNPFVFADEIIQNSTYTCASFIPVIVITVDEI